MVDLAAGGGAVFGHGHKERGAVAQLKDALDLALACREGGTPAALKTSWEGEVLPAGPGAQAQHHKRNPGQQKPTRKLASDRSALPPCAGPGRMGPTISLLPQHVCAVVVVQRPRQDLARARALLVDQHHLGAGEKAGRGRGEVSTHRRQKFEVRAAVSAHSSCSPAAGPWRRARCRARLAGCWRRRRRTRRWRSGPGWRRWWGAGSRPSRGWQS